MSGMRSSPSAPVRDYALMLRDDLDRALALMENGDSRCFAVIRAARDAAYLLAERSGEAASTAPKDPQ